MLIGVVFFVSLIGLIAVLKQFDIPEKEFDSISFAFIIPQFLIFVYIGWFMLANVRFSYLAYKNKWVDMTLKSKLSFDKVSITI